MTPEQENRILNRVDGVHDAVRTLTNAMAMHSQDIAQLKSSSKTTRSWLRRLIDDYEARNKTSLRPPREPMPSLNADDSGSIEIAVLGQRATFTGALPVRIAIGVLIISAALGGGYAIHAAQAAQQQETKK